MEEVRDVSSIQWAGQSQETEEDTGVGGRGMCTGGGRALRLSLNQPVRGALRGLEE